MVYALAAGRWVHQVLAGGCIDCYMVYSLHTIYNIGRLPTACCRRGLMVAQARLCGVHPHVGVPGIDWMKHPLLLGRGPLSEFHLAILPSHQPLLCFHKEAQSCDKGQDKLQIKCSIAAPPPSTIPTCLPLQGGSELRQGPGQAAQSCTAMTTFSLSLILTC